MRRGLSLLRRPDRGNRPAREARGDRTPRPDRPWRGEALMSTIDRLRELMRNNRSAQTRARPTASARDGEALRELVYEPVDEAGLPMPSRDEAPALPGASLLDTPLGRCIHIDHV